MVELSEPGHFRKGSQPILSAYLSGLKNFLATSERLELGKTACQPDLTMLVYTQDQSLMCCMSFIRPREVGSGGGDASEGV